MEIEKVSLAVQIDGEACFVALSQEKLKLLTYIAAGLSESKKLKVIKAPKDYKFQTLNELEIK